MIIGHERQTEYLKKTLRRGKMAHAYFFYGPEETGKFTLALKISKFFHCEKKPENFAEIDENCRACSSINGKAHPEVVILDPNAPLSRGAKEKSRNISIDDVRELKRRLSLAPDGKKWRIAVVNDAHRLSAEAADAILKLLEEPGAQTMLILVSAERGLLPPTVVSRTQSIRFSLVPDAVILNFAETRLQNRELAEEIAFLSRGKPGLAMRLITEKNALEEERGLFREISSFLKKDEHKFASAFRLAEKFSADEKWFKKSSELLLYLLRRNIFAFPELSQTRSAAEKLKKISRALDAAETSNVNPRLALDIIFLNSVL